MPTLKADNKMRELCLAQEGAILLTDAGLPDRVIRVLPLPEQAKKIRDEYNARHASRNPENTVKHVVFDLNMGPHQEAWNEVASIIQRQAPRDRAVPVPRPVASEIGGPWELSPEEVPVVKLTGDTSPVVTTLSAPAAPETKLAVVPTEKKEPEVVKCPHGCPNVLKGKYGLKIHLRKAHKE